MIYTIYDMLRDNIIPGIKQISKGMDLAVREISSVTVQEYPSDNFVQKGELVLSTASGCTDSEDKFCAFLNELSGNGASGVLFAFRDSSYRIPKSAAFLAEELQLPVFTIPWDLRFVQIQTDLIRVIQKKNIEYLTEARLKNDFIWDLSFGNYESLPLMKSIGKRLSFDLNLPYTCIAMQVSIQDASLISDYSGEADENFTEIESAIEICARVMGLKAMYARRSAEIIVFVENSGPSRPETGKIYIERLKSRLEKFSKIYSFSCGISSPGTAGADFKVLYSQAAMALRYAKVKTAGWSIFTYDDAKEARIITCLAESSEVEAMAREVLDGLTGGAPGRSTVLMDTLIEYIRCCGNASKAAEQLYIHRQTLLQRLRKIEEVSGLSLHSSKDMFILEVCTRLFYEI